MYPGTHAATDPGKPAIIIPGPDGQDSIVSYGELDERSLRLARVLRQAGLRRGDHIAFLSDNRTEVFEVYWAALRSGMYVTGINNHLAADEAAYVVNDCGARALVVSAAKAELAAAVVEHTPGVQVRLAFGADRHDGRHADRHADRDGPVPGFDDYDAALASVTSEPLGEQPRGAGHALFLGHHRTPQRYQAHPARPAGRRARRSVRRGVRHPLRLRCRHREAYSRTA
jgi:fatty-acyl-CoA synthase